MKPLSAILAVIFVISAIFGFAVMCHDIAAASHVGMDHAVTSEGCIVGAIAGCSADGLPMAVRHIAAYFSFSNVLVSSLSIAFAILFATIILFVIRSNYSKQISSFLRVLVSYRKKESLSYDKEQYISWLSLFENSPSFV